MSSINNFKFFNSGIDPKKNIYLTPEQRARSFCVEVQQFLISPFATPSPVEMELRRLTNVAHFKPACQVITSGVFTKRATVHIKGADVNRDTDPEYHNDAKILIKAVEHGARNITASGTHHDKVSPQDSYRIDF